LVCVEVNAGTDVRWSFLMRFDNRSA
jgi:hypothetical protein